ncbi:hypothetical protein [Ligilactobacillus agilis]|uniref:hypothetical protein n=1 Tax=Ligilactobacillus agilis TaxID=1601 RepID=UPI001559DAF3|nr:hypothetical protein [Ligilactobacillus agilis]
MFKDIIKVIISIFQFLQALKELILAITHMLEELADLRHAVEKLKEAWNKWKRRK